LITNSLDRYLAAPKKLDKILVVDNIVKELRDSGFSFVRRDPKTKVWYDIGDQLAHEKVSHALRDIHSAKKLTASRRQGESKTKSKKSVEKKHKSLLTLQRSIFRQLLQSHCFDGFPFGNDDAFEPTPIHPCLGLCAESSNQTDVF